MKTEQAIQQVLTTFNGHKLDEEGGLMVSDLDGFGEIDRHVDALKTATRRGDSRNELRKHAKEIAAKALRFMVDQT